MDGLSGTWRRLVVSPSKKETKPVGVAALGASTVTLAVKVTTSPQVAGVRQHGSRPARCVVWRGIPEL
jgi:hypothetical protein